MPHHKSCKKRVKTNEIRRQRNVQRRSRLRHSVRDLRQALAASSSGEEIAQKLTTVVSLLDRMANKGVIHRNQAARLKSRLTQQAAR